jgi:hypothetical protein
MMVDHEARAQLDRQGKALGDVISQLAKDAEKKRQEKEIADQEKARANLIEIQAKVYDKATAYTNLIIAGGYAGSFALWAATRAQLTTKTNVAVALALTVSLASFILFEVYKMTLTAIIFLRNRKFLTAPLTPAEFNEQAKANDRRNQKLMLVFMPVWVCVMFVSVGGALVAFALLFYNYFAVLIG